MDDYVQGIRDILNQISGGGSYECWTQGDSIKIGKWIELSYGFYDDSQVTYIGEYYNGKKVVLSFRNTKHYYVNIINVSGGGVYEGNLEGDSVKVGQWMEQSETFIRNSQITYVGEYKNGKKIGKWRTWFRYYVERWMTELIGGGSYDDNMEGDSVKIGQWVEIGEGFQRISQTTYYGDYKNGRKVGKWNIDLKRKDIGGGFYDNESSHKIGEWIELSDRFYNYSQVTYNGEYKDCRKIGRWSIKFEGAEIGGGFYDSKGFFKTGEWIELSDRFDFYTQVTYQGIYYNSKKIGKWAILWNFKG